MKDYYCNKKFNYLKIDAEKKTTYSCCEATGNPIDVEWLKQNPGKIFNSPILHQERKYMLINKRVQSCEKSCWSQEDNNLPSVRTKSKGDRRLYSDINAEPSTLEITLSGECKLTCSYCCREYSSAWRNDLLKNGDYSKLVDVDINRYSVSTYDKILKYVSQNNRNKLEHYKIIEKEIDLILPVVEKLIITGGEPLLDKRLLSVLEKFKDKSIEIFTGLGVKKNNLKKILKKLSNFKNLVLIISAESVGENYEFNRFGNTWKNFVECLNIIKNYKIIYKFNRTYSNLTVLDYIKFNKIFSDTGDICTLYEPRFMNICVLDNETKQNLLEEITKFTSCNHNHVKIIVDFLSKSPTEVDRYNLEYFVKEFCKRRKIKPNFMPNSLKKWLNLA